MTQETNQSVIIAAVERITQATNYQRGAWNIVIDHARKYAQMKTFGTYLDNKGFAVSVGHGDRESMIEQFQQSLLRATERAFQEDAIAGAALANTLNK